MQKIQVHAQAAAANAAIAATNGYRNSMYGRLCLHSR